MVITDTLEGIIDGRVIYHYDITSDVLYLRLQEFENERTVAEESPNGFLILRAENNDRLAGLTVVNWWKRHGTGGRSDSIHDLESRIEPWARKLAELKKSETGAGRTAAPRTKRRK